jgi:hypothetical protein
MAAAACCKIKSNWDTYRISLAENWVCAFAFFVGNG